MPFAPALAGAPPAVDAAPGAVLLEHARALARGEGLPVPADATGSTASVRVVDSATGTIREWTTTVAEAGELLESQGVDARLVRALVDGPGSPAQTRGAVPEAGVGNNLHAYTHADVNDACDARAYAFTFAAPAPDPFGAPVVVPNPLGTPVAGVTVWGGSAFHVTGEYVVGAHAFLGMPFDVNVNTAAPPADVHLGVDSTMEAAGLGRIVEVNVPLEFFGECLGAYAVGFLALNGALAPA